jgi:hypothetical protein
VWRCVAPSSTQSTVTRAGVTRAVGVARAIAIRGGIPRTMLIFKLLHILSMFTMVTVFSGGELFAALAIRGRDVRALAWLQRLRMPLGIAAFGALVAGVIFGLLTALTGGLNFFDGWLIAAYVLSFCSSSMVPCMSRLCAGWATERWRQTPGSARSRRSRARWQPSTVRPCSLPSTRCCSPRSSRTWC